MKLPNRILPVVAVMVLTAGICNTAEGQLISPGELSAPHQHLEGLDNCTSCHQLRSRGVQNALCLDCHTPLQNRIEQQRGYHATVADQNCASCHKEHFGRTFNAINWDTTRFNHDETGYELIGKHLDLNCRDCHTPTYITDEQVIAFKEKYLALDHTYLGLGTNCENCHETDSPHADQFAGQSCASCHNPTDWTDLALFDHDETRFQLLGKHIDVACGDCHATETTSAGSVIQYTGLAFEACSDCHEDVHNKQLGDDCASCHGEQGWHQFANFPEETFSHGETGFELIGRHASIPCASCHSKAPSEQIQLAFSGPNLNYSYPHPDAENCLSCHVDYHEGVFLKTDGGAVCENCHTPEDWLPTTFDLERHNKETAYALTGAHRATPCFSCHQDAQGGAYTFHFEETECESCHEPDNPHGDEFQNEDGITACADCHSTAGWSLETTFNHDETDFPLTGAHLTVACNDCHTASTATAGQLVRRFDDLSGECESCHSADDPHQGQFAESQIGTGCNACHDTESFRLPGFDHSRTRFMLDGAHRDVPCLSCHETEKSATGEEFVLFRPMEITCESCHGDTN